MDNLLDQLAQFVDQADDLEQLTRPMLELLETVTGLESTYLTTIDEQRGVQRILYSRNSQDLEIPEGLEVPWGDTLCKRALDEGRPFTDDVSGCWGDSEAARALGIQTYLSQPVHTAEGTLYGTLCAASSSRSPVSKTALKVLGLFARLIAQEVDRERELQEMRRVNTELVARATTDPLTGIGNRRALMEGLKRLLSQAGRRQTRVCLAFIDLDGFKAINDARGHDMGDRFLIEIAQRLVDATRTGDLVARYGGDEFVIAGLGDDAEPLQIRLQEATVGRFLEGFEGFDYAGASVGVVLSQPGETDVDALLARGDEAMYRIKQARKSSRRS